MESDGKKYRRNRSFVRPSKKSLHDVNTQETVRPVPVVAHGRMVTSSRQITEVKQRQARLVLGWVTAARVTLPVMCRGVGQASHITLPLSTQQ